MGSAATGYANEDAKWNAVAARDRQADGAFVYAVRTTGVYCRPACPSRRPSRSNVLFFASGQQAQQAGFRPCKKCRPQVALAQSPAQEAVIRACRMIAEAEEPPSLRDLAGAAGLSPCYFHRMFREIVGITPKAYALAQRAQRLQAGLAQPGTVTRAIYEAGFGSSSRCYEGTADLLGMTPAVYKKGGKGLVIRHAVAACYLGWVLVAASDRGLCMIALADTAEELRPLLAARFPRAELVDGDASFAGWVTQVLQLLETPQGRLELPLDIQGTAFQRRVWEALRAIPAGSTASYAELAQRIGNASAVRAVARACASNPLAVVIPCHRAIGKDGGLRGYRWGLDRKQALLDREAQDKGPDNG